MKIKELYEYIVESITVYLNNYKASIMTCTSKGPDASNIIED